VDVEPLNPRYEAMHNVGKQKFSALIVRLDDAILVRIPLAPLCAPSEPAFHPHCDG